MLQIPSHGQEAIKSAVTTKVVKIDKQNFFFDFYGGRITSIAITYCSEIKMLQILLNLLLIQHSFFMKFNYKNSVLCIDLT